MRRNLILCLLALLSPGVAFAACPAIPANCPSPVFNTMTLGVGTSGGIPAFGVGGLVLSSSLLTNHAIVLGGGSGAAPTPLGSLGTTTTLLHGNASGAPAFGAVSLTADVTGVLPVANGGAIPAGTNGQIPVGVTSGTPVFQTLSGDVSAVTVGGSVTVSKIGGTSIALGAGGTFWPGHSLIGVQTFCASGCTATGGTYTADAGTNQVIFEVQAAGGGSGGAASTSGTQSALGTSAAGGSYAKVLYTSSFSGITITIGAVGTAGPAGNNPGTAGTATTVGALISCPGGTLGGGGAAFTATTFAVTNVAAAPAACTISGGTTITAMRGQPSTYGSSLGALAVLASGAGGAAQLGFGGGSQIGATLAGLPGQNYGGGASGGISTNSGAAVAGAAGGPGIVIAYEYN